MADETAKQKHTPQWTAPAGHVVSDRSGGPFIAEVLRIADHVESHWSRFDFEPIALPDIAAEALQDEALHEAFNETELCTWLFFAKELPHQHDILARFGRPPVTIERRSKFFIDVYFWDDQDTSIHDHAFEGAFTNLKGRSINCLHSFDNQRSLGVDVFSGDLRVKLFEELGTGDTRAIVRGPTLIHRVWHIDAPTITLVIRTPGWEQESRQFNYRIPGLAMRFKDLNPIEIRRAQLLHYNLRRHDPARDDTIRKAILSDNEWMAVNSFLTFANYRQVCGDSLDDIERFASSLPNAPWIEPTLQVVRGEWSFGMINWSQLQNPEHRLLLALLLTFSGTKGEVHQIYERLGTHHITNAIGQMVELGAIDLEFGPPHVAILSAMMADLPEENVLKLLRVKHGIKNVTPELLREVVGSIRDVSLLGSLFDSSEGRGTLEQPTISLSSVAA